MGPAPMRWRAESATSAGRTRSTRRASTRSPWGSSMPCSPAMPALRVALEALREARARAVALAGGKRDSCSAGSPATIAFSHWGLERLGPEATLSEIAEGTHAWRFIRALERSPRLGSGELRELLEVDETEISRTGRRLLEAGLVRRSKVGRQVLWELTPRGQRILRATPAPEPRSAGRPPDAKPGGVGADFWMAAIRQGFEGAAGDEPATGRRSVDPTRERIVDTRWRSTRRREFARRASSEIAAKAGVPVETIESYFPTVDDLVKGCGQHVLTSLRLPPPERAAEIFAGASSELRRRADAHLRRAALPGSRPSQGSENLAEDPVRPRRRPR